jgi:hypothetical protein
VRKDALQRFLRTRVFNGQIWAALGVQPYNEDGDLFPVCVLLWSNLRSRYFDLHLREVGILAADPRH